jgi:hypothetical protein
MRVEFQMLNAIEAVVFVQPYRFSVCWKQRCFEKVTQEWHARARGSYFGKSSLCGAGGTVRETEMDGTVYERMVGCTFSVVELAHVLSGS